MEISISGLGALNFLNDLYSMHRFYLVSTVRKIQRGNANWKRNKIVGSKIEMMAVQMIQVFETKF